MDVLVIVLPVFVMLLLGVFCRKKQLLDQNGVNSIKSLVTNVMLPVAVFHALATADYNLKTGKLVGIMLAVLVVSFGTGFLLRPLLDGRYRKYLPFMVSVYEGGLLSYPLYTSLCGQENLSHIAVLDIAGLLFGFSIYMGLLGQVENGGKIEWKKLVLGALRTPAFDASVLGIAAGLSGVVLRLLETPFGAVYQSVENILTVSVTSMILIVVGYSMELTPKLIRPCVKTIGLRAAVQAVMIAGALAAAHGFVGVEKEMDLAMLIYMSAPATFSLQAFVKNEEGNAYVSTTNSLYCIVSLAVYLVVAATM